MAVRGPGAHAGLGARRLAEETRERFLREIVARVPLARLAAVHLFRPMRQGGVESGVAIVAAEPELPPDAIVAAAPEAAPADVDAERADVPEPAAEPIADPIAEPACDPTDAAAGPPPSRDEAGSDDEHEDDDARADAVTDAVTDAGAEAAEEPAMPRPADPPVRHTVLTARYRLTIKGPDRGRWDVEVVEEADAPMLTVDAVVRGVQRRAGDEAAPERLDADAVARLLGQVDVRGAAG